MHETNYTSVQIHKPEHKCKFYAAAAAASVLSDPARPHRRQFVWKQIKM